MSKMLRLSGATGTSYMAPEYQTLEPFPLFVDSAPPAAAHYFSDMGSFDMLSSTITSLSPRPRVSISDKLTNYLRLRYYQYEVTFGLYMLAPTEKATLNTIVFAVLGALLYALYIGLGAFVLRNFCRAIYYITGSLSRSGDLCA